MTPYLTDGDKKKCCCCGICEKCCPVGAIEMQYDEKGFKYPVINREKCIHCGKCKEVCQYSNFEVKKVNNKIHAVVGKLKDIDILDKSSSGGAFYALATAIINKGGIVYGAAWTDELSVQQFPVEQINKLTILQGSKYVFSDVKDTFFAVKESLMQHKKVLYSGTPCQINSLYAFLGKDYENLYTCDLICHGIPSQKYLDIFIGELEKKYKSQAMEIYFKDKTIDWRNPCLSVKFKNDAIYREPIWQTPYGKFYHDRLTVMSACDSCRYATLPRKSDITIGDFWNYKEKVHMLESEKKGISSLLINTCKGEELFQEAKGYLKWRDVSLEDVMQLHLKESAKAASDDKKVRFEKYISRMTMFKTAKKIDKDTPINELRELVSKIRKNLMEIINN